MEKELTLVIMAGGLGSRFGGLKQVEPIDDQNNFIIDYSVFDAVRAGFNKIVFIIKEEHYEIFKSTIGSRISKTVNVDYAFQGKDSFVPKELCDVARVKPWGTGHAVLCAKDKVKGDFAVINADDFYGREGFEVASKFFKENKDPKTYGLVGYLAGNTLTENGAVKRGVCLVKNGLLKSVDESSIEKINGKIIATSLATKVQTQIAPTQLVSMNLSCFKHNYFDVLEKAFSSFLHDKTRDLQKDEFLILSPIEMAERTLGIKVKVLSTSAVWHGVTYKEDKQKVVDAIQKLREKGVYPTQLWNKK
jgi:UTP-glucose-1-phosphate uridylyltransferase